MNFKGCVGLLKPPILRVESVMALALGIRTRNASSTGLVDFQPIEQCGGTS